MPRSEPSVPSYEIITDLSLSGTPGKTLGLNLGRNPALVLKWREMGPKAVPKLLHKSVAGRPKSLLRGLTYRDCLGRNVDIFRATWKVLKSYVGQGGIDRGNWGLTRPDKGKKMLASSPGAGHWPVAETSTPGAWGVGRTGHSVRGFMGGSQSVLA